MTILTLKRKIYKVSELKNIRMFPGDPTGSPDDFFLLKLRRNYGRDFSFY